MKKAMFLLLLPFLAAAMFLLSSAPAESRTVQDIQSYVDAAKALNLSEGNLQVKSNEFDVEEILKDARFMGLLRGRIRIARLVDRAMRDSEGGNGDLNTEVGPIVAFLLSGQNGLPTMDNIVKNAVSNVVKPLELEGILKELPRYYDAVVNTADWQKKFQKILSQKYTSLNGGTIFHLAGFPEIGDKPYYMGAMDIELTDSSLYLDEWDSSTEAWLYSFWMRRWLEGTMDAARVAVDLLNKALGQ